MNKDDEKSKVFTRRAIIVGAFQGSLLAVLGGRLAWLQLAQGKKYKTLADRNRINIKMLSPTRGEIVDRFGVPLAINNQNYMALLIPEQTDDIRGSLEKLANLIDIDSKKIEKILLESKKSASFIPIEIKDDLSWDDVSKLEVNITDLPGISIDEGEIRNYPFGEATGHIIGYVGAVSDKDMTDDPILTLPGFRIGKTAIEKSYDIELRGKSGISQMEVNVRGREVRELDTEKSVGGQRIALTIDAELQRFSQQRLSEYKSASAIVMDAHTGAIYSMVSYPGFDPNLFTRGISTENWEELLSNPAFPLNNKAVSGQYPPGSTFKMITALAALEQNLAKANTSVRCTGTYEYGTDKFRCWKLSGHGMVNVTSALMKSCDTYFYKLSTDIGIDNIAAMAQKFGLGQKYNFDLKEERAGLLPTKEWKMSEYGKNWQPGETIVASIGQGYILATPLQLAVMTSRLVNGGYAVKPWLVGYVGHQKIFQEKWPLIGIKQENLDIIKTGMDQVVNNNEGTAYSSRIDEEGMQMGGKTGTAQVKRINRAERAQGIMNEDLEWKYRHHALFVGYAPVSNPRYVCSVVVEHGGGGSAVAAPLARDILREAQIRNPAREDIKLSQISSKIGGIYG
ncbi:MAG: penicillin-binding protein 2 [Alphaproteobacteria bacterium]